MQLLLSVIATVNASTTRFGDHSNASIHIPVLLYIIILLYYST